MLIPYSSQNGFIYLTLYLSRSSLISSKDLFGLKPIASTLSTWTTLVKWANSYVFSGVRIGLEEHFEFQCAATFKTLTGNLSVCTICLAESTAHIWWESEEIYLYQMTCTMMHSLRIESSRWCSHSILAAWTLQKTRLRNITKGIQTDVSFEPNIAGSYNLGPVGGEFTVYFSDYCIFCELPLHTRFYE